MLRTQVPKPPHRSAGEAKRVRFNGEGSKSASSPVRAGKLKKQRRAPREYVRPRDWKLVHRYPTGGRAQLDADDIEFDIYKRAREVMELSGLKMLPEQEVQVGGVHLWRLTCQASTASNGFAIREYACPMRHMYKCKVGLRIVEALEFMQVRIARHGESCHPAA